MVDSAILARILGCVRGYSLGQGGSWEGGSREGGWGDVLAVAEEVVLVLADLDGGAAELGYQHPVALRNAHGHAVPLLVEQAGADGHDPGLVELLDARLGEEDAAGGLGLGLDALDEDAVEEGHEALDGADGGGLWGLGQRWVLGVRCCCLLLSSRLGSGRGLTIVIGLCGDVGSGGWRMRGFEIVAWGGNKGRSLVW